MKKQELSWKAGGQQGEGLESLGEIFAAALCSLGYDVYGYRQFSSRIKGGHTSYKLRIANHPVATIATGCNLLIAMDPDTLAVDAPELSTEGVLVADTAWLAEVKPKVRTVALSWNELSKTGGKTLPKNILALGITAALLGIDTAKLLSLLEKQYGRKGAEVMATNRLALETGHDYIKNNYADLLGTFTMPELENPQPKLFMLGNEAIALGALTAGAKFMSAYPITPSSEIMEYMVKYAPDEGGVMLQTEDEIAACTMAIGASYAGARAFTATAGPGLSLMAEAIGLAEMTETPLVLVDTQRGGPSTGLPTKHEQSDLMAAIYNTHGDTGKIVLSPSSIEEAFYYTFEAFNLAEEYQCPVIVLSDLQLSLGKQSVTSLDYDKLQIRRGKLVKEGLPEIKSPEYFKRYDLDAEDNISLRALPGTPNGISLGTGLEHDEVGRPSENKAMRTDQTNKRLRKMRGVIDTFDQPLYEDAPYAQSDLLIIGMAGTRAVISEVADELREKGLRVNHVQMRLLSPFPVCALNHYLQEAKKIVVVEHNATAQLARLIKMNAPPCPELHSILKYNGDIFYKEELLAKCKEVL